MKNPARLLDGYPFDSPWVRAWLATWVWPLWFGFFSALHVAFLWSYPGSFGLDVRVYQLAARAWLAGGDPWDAAVWMGPDTPAVYFAGPPPTLGPFVLVAWSPVEVVILVVVLGLGASALWVIRRLRLPLYWLLFPPILDAIWVGNLDILVIALLVFGLSAAGAVAAVLKIYALVPLVMLGRYRSVALAGAMLIVTAPLLPWRQFVDDYGAISATLAAQSWSNPETILTGPLAKVGGALALVLLGRQRAAWLAVPVLWPSTQLHYSVLALPVFAAVPALAFAGTVPAPGILGLGVMLFALWERRVIVADVWTRLVGRLGLGRHDPGAHSSVPAVADRADHEST